METKATAGQWPSVFLAYSSQAVDFVPKVDSYRCLVLSVCQHWRNLLHHCPFSHQGPCLLSFLRSRRLSWAMERGSEEAQQSLSIGHLWQTFVGWRLGAFSQGAVAQMVKNLPAKQETWVWRAPGEGNDNPLQFSCLENPTDRGGWQVTWCCRELDMTERLSLAHSSAWGGNFQLTKFSVSVSSDKGYVRHAICIILFKKKLLMIIWYSWETEKRNH